MTHALDDPVNLIGELDEYTSFSCARRVLARTLGHSGLDLAGCQEVWLIALHDPDRPGNAQEQWGKYGRVIQTMI